MILSKKAIEWLTNNRKTRTRIAITLEAHPATVDRWVSQNNKNLTKADALNVIQQDSGMNYGELLINEEPPRLTHEIK